MSQLMSTFYRTTLNKGRSDILLRDEIRNVVSYIEIQQLLHDNAFQVLSQIDPTLPEIYVPNLILQPLVENSIIHGILPKQTGEGKLFLTIRRVDNMVHFTVMDNGVGIPPEKIPLLTQTESSGYGLKNVNERLLLTYGESSTLKINSIQNESTMITFSIPICTDNGSTPFYQRTSLIALMISSLKRNNRQPFLVEKRRRLFTIFALFQQRQQNLSNNDG